MNPSLQYRRQCLLRVSYFWHARLLGTLLIAFGAINSVPAAHGATLTSLYNFPGPDDQKPTGALTKGADGSFYGTTSGGTSGGKGTIFKITPDGVLTTIHSFTGGTDNSGPVGKLALADDGNFYGVTIGNLYPYYSTFFKVTPGGTLTTLYDFTPVNGHPKDGAIQGSDGNFYGVAHGGPYPSYGIVYKITSAGELTTLHLFNGTDGENPEGRLVEGTDGNFYGTTNASFGNTYGTVFKIAPAGTLTTLHTFNFNDGANPSGSLIQAKDGKFYGTTSAGGLNGAYGTVFSITSSGTFKTLFTFAGDCECGASPAGGLVQGSDGNFYGTTPSGGNEDVWGTVYMITPAGVFTTLYSFDGSDGGYSVAELIEGDDGYFYGTTEDGGRVYLQGETHQGTVFKITLANTPLVTLHRFNGTDGSNPIAGLIRASDGNFYGTTAAGGDADHGTIFRITPAGILTTLHSFDEIDGNANKLLQNNDGNFYGTTVGANTIDNTGTVFKITPGGALTTLYRFAPLMGDQDHRNADGAVPNGPLCKGDDGNFYGTTYEGGLQDGTGTAFKVTPTGALTSLHSFDFNSPDGSFPLGGLVQGSDGALYGTTSGSNYDYSFGEMFRITTAGVYTSMHVFTDDDLVADAGTLIDGGDGNFYGTGAAVFKITPLGDVTPLYAPVGALGSELIHATDGNFYGVSGGDGFLSQGFIFRISSTGVYTRLYDFHGPDGQELRGGLAEGVDGNLYGTTAEGGSGAGPGLGTVFELLINSSPADKPAQAGNISTRLSVGTGDNVLIGGFIVTGTQPKKVILRGIGPSLPVTGALANPFLELHDSSGAVIASNDDWINSPDKQAIIDSTIPPTNNKESAIVMTLNPGAYTAIVRGVGNTTGVALVEAYDLDQTVDSKLANISTRGFVQTGDNAMIGGVIVLGDLPTALLVRAIGPSLPVSGTLADPTLELYDSSGALVATNDNWRSDQEADIIATTVQPGNDLESAIVARLAPGAYTAIVRGVNNTTGVALVEAYDLGQ